MELDARAGDADMKTLPSLTVVAALATPSAAQSAYEVGAPLLELRLPDITDASTIDLAQFRGRKLVLFEFASW